MAEPFVDIIKYLSFRPSRARTGALDASVLDGLNMVPKGPADAPYFENIKSKRDTGYAAAGAWLTGTVTVDGYFVTGTGTAFLTELQNAQFVIIARRLVLVRRVISNTSFEGSVDFAANPVPQTVLRPRLLQLLDGRRATYLRGNVFEAAKKHIIGVGDGALQMDGAALPGGGFTLSKKLRVALYDQGTGNYTQIEAGFAVADAADFAVAEVAGGTLAMPAGKYSLRFVAARTSPTSWNNPSEPVQVDLVIAGDKLRVTFNVAMDTVRGQDAWRVYVTLANQQNGPWFFLREITATDLSGTGAGTTFDLEWLKGNVEFNETVDFRNFAPPDASFVTAQSGVLLLYGTDGAGGSTPGPGIRVADDDNIEGWDPDRGVRLDEEIIGVVQGVGRDYVGCAEGVYIATLSGERKKSITWRPFWSAGVFHPNQLVFVNDQLFGCTRSGPRRSVADGDKGSETWDFAVEVISVFDRWIKEHVIVAHDPLNEAVCYVHPSPTVDSNNRMYAEMLQYNLRTGRWTTPLRLDDAASDIIVSSAYGLESSLSFVANSKVYEHDTGTDAVRWYLAGAFVKRFAQQMSVFALAIVGLLTDAALGVCGFGVDQDAPDLSADVSASLTGAVELADSAACHEYQAESVLATDLDAYSVKVQGTYAGGGAELNRVESILVQGNAARKPF